MRISPQPCDPPTSSSITVAPWPAEGELHELRPLSRSPLWQIQQRYFTESGFRAWSSGDVPHGVTSSPMLARTYSQVIEGFVYDCAAGHFGPVDPDQPVYVVELGAGTGRLGFHIVRALERAPLPLRVVYVLTDGAPANVAGWQAHPRLAPLIEAGRIDTASFDVTRDTSIHLNRQDLVLSPEARQNPMGVVANYLFDVIPQDLLMVVDGELYEELIAIEDDPRRGSHDGTTHTGSGQAPSDISGSEAHANAERPRDEEDNTGNGFGRDFLSTMSFRVRRQPVEPGRFADPIVAATLDRFCSTRTEDVGPNHRFLFPSDAVGCLARLSSVCDGRMLLLVGERPGEPAEPDLQECDIDLDGDKTLGGRSDYNLSTAQLGLAVHGGSFSLPIEIEVLQSTLDGPDTHHLVPQASPTGLVVSATTTGSAAVPPATAHRFHMAVDGSGPEDLYLTMRTILDRGTDDLPLSVLLALIRVSGDDPYLISSLRGALGKGLSEAAPNAVREALEVLARVVEVDFPISDDVNLPLALSALLADAGWFGAALHLLERSNDLYPADAQTDFHTALCHLHLGQIDDALAALASAVDKDPAMEKAGNLRIQVIEERGRRQGEAEQSGSSVGSQ